MYCHLNVCKAFDCLNDELLLAKLHYLDATDSVIVGSQITCRKEHNK